MQDSIHIDEEAFPASLSKEIAPPWNNLSQNGAAAH
jgi:hypothetical protein